eukprot:4444335-Alexandrium_andersonii.AAC.1
MPRSAPLLQWPLCILVRRGRHGVREDQGEGLGDLMCLRQRAEALSIGHGSDGCLALRIIAFVKRAQHRLVGGELITPPRGTVRPPPGLRASDAGLLGSRRARSVAARA